MLGHRATGTNRPAVDNSCLKPAAWTLPCRTALKCSAVASKRRTPPAGAPIEHQQSCMHGFHELGWLPWWSPAPICRTSSLHISRCAAPEASLPDARQNQPTQQRLQQGIDRGSQEERRSKAKQELQLPTSLGSRPQQQELEQQQEQEQQQLLQQMPPPQWYVEDYDYTAAEDGPLQQQQQQQPSSPPPWQQPRQAEGYLPYNYDKSRRRTMPTSQWGPPPKRNDYLIVTPTTSPPRHANYLAGRILRANKGNMLLLFHSHQGASRALSVLHIAARLLQRKHRCTLLCDVALSQHEPLNFRLMARLWPYAGVIRDSNDSAAAAAAAAGGGGRGGAAAVEDCQASAAAAGEQQNNPGGGVHVADSSNSAHEGSAAAAQGADGGNASTNEQQPLLLQQQQKQPRQGHPRWLKNHLEGSVPHFSDLPVCVRHLPPFALPAVVSRRVTLTVGRHTDPDSLARRIASCISLKGRCRVLVAGGLAALNALTAAARADLLLQNTNGRALVLHVQYMSKVEPSQQMIGNYVWYYQLTFLAARRGDRAPVTSTFPVDVKLAQQLKEQWQQQRWQQQEQAWEREWQQREWQRQQQERQRQRSEDDETAGYLW